MFSILSTTSHGNAVKVYNLKQQSVIRKVGTSDHSNRYIANEYEGLTWYTGLHKKNPCQNIVFQSGKSFSMLELPVLQNYFQVSHLAPLSITYNYLNKVIDHYVETWPDTSIANVHGDLTLANILFNEDDIFIIDWEHFVRDQLPRGYDLGYLILSALLLPNYSRFNRMKLNKKDILLFKMLMDKIGPIFDTSAYYSGPLQELQHRILHNEKLQKIAFDSPYKLFPLLFDADLSYQIDQTILSF